MKKFFFAILILNVIGMNAQTKVIAHRGYWQTTPITAENSLQSLKNAQKLKIYGSEFDVRMTKDGFLIVNHDEHHADMVIEQTDLKELEKVKLTNGEDFPLLKDYLKAGKTDSELKLIVEIKPASSKELEKEIVHKTIKMINKMKLSDQIEFISFSLIICKEIKKIEPKFKVQYLKGDLSPAEIANAGLDGIDYHFSVFEKNPTWIADAKALRLITNSWTVNDVAVFQKLKLQNIDFVTTNIPDQFKNQ